MKSKILLDYDMVALETEDEITLMLDLMAPASDKHLARPGQSVECVIDRSGSMQGPKIAAAKGSILKLIERLAPQDFFGLVAFDDSAQVIVPNLQMSSHNQNSIKKAIEAIEPGGSTDISAGYLLGLRQVVQSSAPGGSTVLLVSDGEANAGESNPEFFRNVATKSATERVQSASIGLGLGYDETILEAIAQGGGGSHRFASSIDEAIGALAAEVQDLTDKSIVNAMLRIKPSNLISGHPLVQVLQRLPHWQEGSDYVVQLGDLYSGENRRFIIKLRVPEIAALGLCKIADIAIEYLDLAAQSEISVTMPVNVNVVPGDLAAGRIQEPVVRAERLILEIQDVKEDANSEVMNGNEKKAAELLKSAAARLRREATSIPVADAQSSETMRILNKEATELEALSELVIHESPNFSAKRMRESHSRSTRSRQPRTEENNDEKN